METVWRLDVVTVSETFLVLAFCCLSIWFSFSQLLLVLSCYNILLDSDIFLKDRNEKTVLRFANVRG